MRPKVFIPILILALAILAVMFWLRPNPAVINLRTITEPVASSNSPVKQSSNDNTNVLASVAPPAPTAVQKPVMNDRLKTNEIREYMESQNKPIDFYGQIIDQDGNPLAGVSVKGEALHIKVIIPAPFGDEDQIIPIDQKTDLGGRFEIKGISGRSVNIESIQKNGYEVEPDNCPHVFGPSIGVYENPTVFKMWSTNIHEQLITGNKSFEIVPDGRPYFINLTDGTISEHDNGDLKIFIQYTNQVVQGQLYDWFAKIEVINGGLCEVSQAAINSGFLEEPPFAMYSAPNDGYIPSFSLKKQIKGGQSGEIGNRFFYLLLNNGKAYGRMSINLFAPYGRLHPGLIRLSYAINQSGSHILR